MTMRVRVLEDAAARDARERDVCIDVVAHDATAGDLARALGWDALAVDGRAVDEGEPLHACGLHEAAILSPSEPRRSIRHVVVVELAVTGGLDAGRRFLLPSGDAVIGRGRVDVHLDHRTVSRRHARLRVGRSGPPSIADLGSTNGTWVGPVAAGVAAVELDPADECRLGALRLTVRAQDGADPPARASSFNRPPRSPLPPVPAEVVPPRRPDPPPARVPINVASVLAPLAIAAAMVLVVRNAALALFAVLSPVVLIANAWENRHRSRREVRRGERRWAAELARFETDVEAAAEAARERLGAICPDLAEVARRAARTSPALWQRRPREDDFLHVRIGSGVRIRDGPITVDLRHGPLGIVGPRGPALAVARGVVAQVAVHHGPADVTITALVDPSATDEWDWLKWLPHAAPATSGQTAFAVVHGADLLTGRASPARVLFAADGVSGVVVAATTDELPARCAAVLELDGDDGVGELSLVGDGARTTLMADGMAADVARALACALAPIDDPELPAGVTALPASVRLVDLLAPAAIDRRRNPGLRAPLGAGIDGVVMLDLVADGPHALVAGTTGSGKSELLRALVAGLAACNTVEHLALALVDFKGGTAFAACARLPHVVGFVTDLDEALAARALRCLEAELRFRERVLRDAGANDITDYLAQPRRAPLPRLVVVVDEFATLRDELPDFVSALVGVAQRGRGLGVHLVLATQRPSGAVSDDIRANTNIRIALRVQDAPDSTDVIGAPDAASLPRALPGRALVRLGPAEVVTVQAAFVGGPAVRGPRPRVVVTPFALTPVGDHEREPTTEHAPAATDLSVLVDSIVEDHHRRGLAPPRRLWPPPLPADVELDTVVSVAVAAPNAQTDLLPFLLLDDPDAQAQHVGGWRPRAGNLLLLGGPGSGATTALASIALSLARTCPPDAAHLYAIDLGAGELVALDGLPQCGAVVVAGEVERLRRLVRFLVCELAERRSRGAVACRCLPAIVVLVDGAGALTGAVEGIDGLALLDDLTSVVAGGPEVGIAFALAADRAGAVPAALAALATDRLVFRSADGYELVSLGVNPRDVGELPPGRAVAFPSRFLAHVARPTVPLAEAVVAVARSVPPPVSPPAAIGVLPAVVPVAAVAPGSVGASRPWRLSIAVADDDLRGAALPIHEAEHVLVAGPARSGRTTALLAIEAAFRHAVPDGTVTVVAPPRSPLAPRAGAPVPARGPALVLVDDADRIDDDDGVLAALLAGTDVHPDVHVVAAARSDALRARYDHWTRAVRRSGLGLLLQPDVDVDGDLLGVRLPRRPPIARLAGRGYLVADGAVRLVQLASPAP